MAKIAEFYGRDIAHKADFILTAAGDIDTISGLENVKGAILRRIMTSKGSIIHRPNYGVGLKNYQNLIGSIQNQRKLALEIQEQLERDSRVEAVTGVRVIGSSTVAGQFELLVKVKLVGYGEQQVSFVNTLEV